MSKFEGTPVNRRMLLATGLAGAATACVTPLARIRPNGPPIVSTSAGKVQGALAENGVRVFKGIPYGASTGGQGRFRAPRPPAPWTGIRDDDRLGPPTPQGRPRTRRRCRRAIPPCRRR